jgi:thiol-disulfide isomerase/thioredoxin
MLIGTPATSFKFKTLKGDSISLSELKGKVVFLNVFQSLCGPCLKEIPFLANLSETYRGLDVVFLAVSIRDSKENLHWVNKRYAPQAEDSPLIFVPASYFGNREDSFTSMENKETGYLNETFYLFRDNYYVRINPISYLIDQDGIIREIFRGYNAKYDHTDFYSEAINILLRK